MLIPIAPPYSLGLPFDAWRVGQRNAVRAILNAETRHVAVTAPTGAGKSVIAAALPRLEPQKRHVTLTATKILQDQYTRTFDTLVDLRGGANYHCRAAETTFAGWYRPHQRRFVTCDQGPCHIGEKCPLKEQGCDYFDARARFVASEAGLTNYAMWFSHRNAGGVLGQVDRLVCDEAHALPEQLMETAGVQIPSHLLVRGEHPTTVKAWREWAGRTLTKLTRTKEPLSEALVRGLTRVQTSMDETWAWEANDYGEVKLEPTIPRLLLPHLLAFDATRQEQIVYLSATLTPSLFTVLGIPHDQVAFHSIPPQFSPASRPITFIPGSRGDWRSQQDEWQQQKMVDAVDAIIDARRDRKGIVHSVSYKRGKDLYNASTHLTSGRLLLHRQGDRLSDVCAQFRKAPMGTVLISPSVMTGVDFPYDDARYQIVPKMPFFFAKSPIMQARSKNTRGYKEHWTMQRFIQMCGRIVRAEDDWGETLVTDEIGSHFWRDHKDLAPDWFYDAVSETRRIVAPMQPV
jgi:Rad3-related DNA helicase